MPFDRVLPLRLTAAAAVLFAAGWLPWGTVNMTPFDGFPGGDGLRMSQDLTGWSGSASFLGVWTPFWTSFAAALLLALWSWFDRELAAKAWPRLLAALFVVHGLWVVKTLLTTTGARLGLGTVVSIVTWAVVFVVLSRQSRLPAPEPATQL